MKARFEDKLSIHLSIEDQTRDALVPSFILQPLLENSIKFSMQSLKETKINLNSRKEDNNLIITIRDNGPGISEDKNQILRNGVGLSNTMERLEKLYDKNHQFHLRNMERGGFEVQMIFPFQQNGEENPIYE